MLKLLKSFLSRLKGPSKRSSKEDRATIPATQIAVRKKRRKRRSKFRPQVPDVSVRTHE